MLCAKNLKVALAAILGVVSLVGAGTAHAVVNLNPSTDADQAQYFAAERVFALTTSTDVNVVVATATSTTGYFVKAASISAGFEANETYYLRYDLFDGDPDNVLAGFSTDVVTSAMPSLGTGVTGSATTTAARVLDLIAPADPVADRNTNYAVIYAIETGGNAIDAREAVIDWPLTNDGIMLGLTEVEDREFSIRLTIWDTRAEARRADLGLTTGLGSSAQIWTSATVAIAKTMRTVSTSVTMPQTLTASVASNFRRFLVDGTATTSATQGTLATANASITNTVMGSGRAILNVNVGDGVNDAMQVTLDHVIDDVTATVTAPAAGNAVFSAFHFGDFYIGGSCGGDEGTSMVGRMTRVPPMGTTTVTVARTTSLTGTFGGATADFCVNVTGNTAASDFEKIEEAMYNMTLTINLNDGGTVTRMVPDSTAAGKIMRDGTSVRIAYLTTATNFRNDGGVGTWAGWTGGSYNQRLTITNHSNATTTFTLADFVAEAGVTVGCASSPASGTTCPAEEPEPDQPPPPTAVTGVIPPATAVVFRVAQLISITGGPSRAAATLELVARPQDVSVVTTQVTLPEGQTDTVRYQ